MARGVFRAILNQNYTGRQKNISVCVARLELRRKDKARIFALRRTSESKFRADVLEQIDNSYSRSGEGTKEDIRRSNAEESKQHFVKWRTARPARCRRPSA